MREFKFRGKNKKSKNWIFGSLMLLGENQEQAVIFPCLNEFVISEKGEWFEVRICGETEINNDEPQIVSTETVGQFVGLLDTKGNDIYEGDILKDNNGLISTVEYTDGGYWLIHKDGSFGISNVYITAKKACVIGNIHDNSELLKEQE